MAARTAKDDGTFEALYERLEAAVSRLEQGGLTLDEAIACYEEGMKLARACQERLDRAEQRITKLRASFAHPDQSAAAGADDPDEGADDVEYVEDGDAAYDGGGETYP